jgi:hypothetical protein
MDVYTQNVLFKTSLLLYTLFAIEKDAYGLYLALIDGVYEHIK